MTYTPPGQEPEQPSYSTPQPDSSVPQGYSAPDHSGYGASSDSSVPQSYSTPQPDYSQSYGQQPGYAAPSYGTPQYDVGQQSYVGYAQPAKPKSDKATLGLWALISALSGIILPIGLNSLAAIGLGIAGLVKENPKGMSITGLVLGGVQLLIGLPVFWFGVVPIIAAVALYGSTGYYP